MEAEGSQRGFFAGSPAGCLATIGLERRHVSPSGHLPWHRQKVNSRNRVCKSPNQRFVLNPAGLRQHMFLALPPFFQCKTFPLAQDLMTNHTAFHSVNTIMDAVAFWTWLLSFHACLTSSCHAATTKGKQG